MATQTTFNKTEVTLKMLVDSGLISANAELSSSNPSARAVLDSNGSLTVFFQDKKKVFHFLSGAARFIEGKSLNGWLYWCITVNNEKVPLDNFRDKFLRNSG